MQLCPTETAASGLRINVTALAAGLNVSDVTVSVAGSGSCALLAPLPPADGGGGDAPSSAAASAASGVFECGGLEAGVTRITFSAVYPGEARRMGVEGGGGGDAGRGTRGWGAE